jgi:hypothetical protein
MDVGPDRSSLQAMEKDNKESIKEYTQRWYEAVVQINLSLLEKKGDQFIFQHFQGSVLWIPG